MAYDIQLTARGGGYFRLFVNGKEISKHSKEREAAEAATEAKLNDPTAEVYYDHENYKVDVEIVQDTPTTDPPTDPPVDPPVDPPEGAITVDLNEYNAFDVQGFNVVDHDGEYFFNYSWQPGQQLAARAHWAISDNPIGETPLIPGKQNHLFVRYCVYMNDISMSEKQSRITSFHNRNWAQNWIVHFWGNDQDFIPTIDVAGIDRDASGNPLSTKYNEHVDWSLPHAHTPEMAPKQWHEVILEVDLDNNIVRGWVDRQETELTGCTISRDSDQYGVSAFFLEVSSNNNAAVRGSRTYGRVRVSDHMIPFTDMNTLPTLEDTPAPPVDPPVDPPTDPPVIPPSTGSAWFHQSWETMNNTQEVDNTVGYVFREGGDISLITGLRNTPGGFTKAIRAKHEASKSHKDSGVGIELYFPRAGQDKLREIWVEWIGRFSDNWTTNGPYGGSSDHKLFFLFDQAHSGSWRWAQHMGVFGGQIDMRVRGYSRFTMPPIWDGQWHTFRYHAKMGNPGVWEGWVDSMHLPWSGPDVRTDLDRGARYYFNDVTISRTLNKGVGEDQYLDIGPVKAYNTNPGW